MNPDVLSGVTSAMTNKIIMAATVGSSLFAALAFSGAGYLFHLLDRDGYSAEIKRHN